MPLSRLLYSDTIHCSPTIWYSRSAPPPGGVRRDGAASTRSETECASAWYEAMSPVRPPPPSPAASTTSDVALAPASRAASAPAAATSAAAAPRARAAASAAVRASAASCSRRTRAILVVSLTR